MEHNDAYTDKSAILTALSYDLRLPLLQIKTRIEAIDGNQANEADLTMLYQSSSSGLRLLDAYLLALSLEKQTELPLEPVSIGALLDESAHAVESYAKQYDTELRVALKGRLEPVLVHRPSAFLALSCLAESIIRAQAGQNVSKRINQVQFGAHRLGTQIITGVYGAVEGLSEQMLRSARKLAGVAQQPHAALSAHSGSGILIAESLCMLSASPLRHSQHNKAHGLATVLQVSNQLTLL